MTAHTKADIRARIRADRPGWSGAPINTPRVVLNRLARRGTIGSYLPIAGEIDPAPIVAAAVALGWRLALPHVTTRDAPMRFLQWTPGAPLEAGPFGLRQPASDAAEMSPDLVLTPLLAFDSTLNRLGQGAGYYDRAFAALPHALRIGVAWSHQAVPKVPVDPWDVPLHGIVTENGWIGPETL